MHNPKEHKRISKFLSLVLRHKPEVIDLNLDEHGWVDVKILLDKMKENRRPISKETLRAIVSTNDKQRFAFNDTETRIRANQGHSIEIELNYSPLQPPDILYHGTAHRNKASIFENGLQKGKRHHVHLSKDVDTAINVGKRHGIPIVLEVLAKNMYEKGHNFYCSDNGVWLTDHIHPKYLRSQND